MELEDPVDRRHVAFGVIIMALGLLFLMDQLEIVQQAVLGLFWPGCCRRLGIRADRMAVATRARSEAFGLP